MRSKSDVSDAALATRFSTRRGLACNARASIVGVAGKSFAQGVFFDEDAHR